MSGELRAALRRHFGFESLREGQEAVISRLLEGRATLALLPTGGGKSLCYQLPALLLDGLTLVVSPLIALMRDQVEQLRARGIPAARLDSSLDEKEAARVFERLRDGELKLLYCAPESLARADLLDCLMRQPPALLAIDEAHCISEWGHQFRPDYLSLGKVAKKLKASRVLALTATATPQVARDIRKLFRIARQDQIQTSYERSNLSLRVTPCAVRDRLPLLRQRLHELAKPSIVYVTRQQTAEAVATALQRAGLKARAYHAGMTAADREDAQRAFMNGTAEVVVATLAFGMGIDKADIRAVFHFNAPKSLENYQQETGRAGRDGMPAVCELLCSEEDFVELESLVSGGSPAPRALRHLVDHLLRQGPRLDISIHELSIATDLRTEAIETVLARLELAGILAPAGSYHGVLQFRLLQPEGRILTGRSPAEQAMLQGWLSNRAPNARWIRLENETGAKLAAAQQLLQGLNEAGEIELRLSGARRCYRLSAKAKRADPVAMANDMAGVFAEQERHALERLDQVRSLATTSGCLTRGLLRHFGEHSAASCGRCESCLNAGRKRRLPKAAAAEWSDGEMAAIQAMLRERHAALRGARQVARFFCGVGSPAVSKARLYRRDEFGLLRHRSFREVLAQTSTMTDPEG